MNIRDLTLSDPKIPHHSPEEDFGNPKTITPADVFLEYLSTLASEGVTSKPDKPRTRTMIGTPSPTRHFHK